MITGINLNFLKLLPKLKKLSLDGIQRRNAGACWTPRSPTSISRRSRCSRGSRSWTSALG